MYQERMMGYYPQVISAITEFQALVYGEAPEFEKLNESRQSVLNNTHFTTMDESRIEQWEKVFGITPIEDSTLDDRRDTLIARMRGQGKLNTKLINSIVNAFTGGTAKSWVEDGTLHVEITPPPNNKQYQFDNVKRELADKVPAHLNLIVSRNYCDWGEAYVTFGTWQKINDLGSWNDVYMYVSSDSKPTVVVFEGTTVTDNYFRGLKNVKEIKLPYVERIERAILHSSDVETLDIGANVTHISTAAFANASKLSTLIIRNLFTRGLITLGTTPIQKGNGYVYVPDEYVEQYKTGALKDYSNQVKAISELPTKGA